MAPKRLYPRSTIKKIIKAHSSRGLSKNADLLVSHASRRQVKRTSPEDVLLTKDADIFRLYPLRTRVSLCPIFQRKEKKKSSCNGAVLMVHVIHSLVEEASMSSKMKNQKGITAESIREVTAVGVRCGFDVTMKG